MFKNVIPAYCPSCGAIFKSRLISMSGNVSNTSLIGNMESCPFCNSMAKTAEGVFDISDNILKVISSPEITKQMLHEFSGIVKKAYKNKLDIDTLAKEADKINPEFGSLVRNKKITKLFKYPFLLLLIFMLNSCEFNVNVSLDINELINQISDTPPTKIIGESINEIKYKQKHKNKKFERKEVQLDGNSFINCHFIDSKLIYSGGELPQIADCSLVGSNFIFSNQAANTVQFMNSMHYGGFEAVIEEIFKNIRNSTRNS